MYAQVAERGLMKLRTVSSAQNTALVGGCLDFILFELSRLMIVYSKIIIILLPFVRSAYCCEYLSLNSLLIRIRIIYNASYSRLIGIINATDITEAFLLGCADVKAVKTVQISIACLHRLIDNGAVAQVWLLARHLSLIPSQEYMHKTFMRMHTVFIV